MSIKVDIAGQVHHFLTLGFSMRRFYQAIVGLAFAGLIVGLQPNAVSAYQGKNEKGPAHTSAPSGDENFPLMGEFVGTITNDETLALQIRVIGTDRFDAMAYRGGLPGESGHQSDAIRFIGMRSENMVILSGGPWAIFVENDTCSVVDRTGNKIGSLNRVKRTSPTMYAAAPSGATVLFDGTGTDQFTKAEMTPDGLLMQGADVKPMFQDFDLHIEFKLPYMPVADEQNRANSGLYLQSSYECQVLDSFAQEPKFNGCGALYRFKKPDVNMCLPPLTWQTYDVRFTAPRWAADGTKVRNAFITSWVNGVKVQDNVELKNKTGAGKAETPTLFPIRFQDHGDPVRFRNAWVVDRGLTSVQFPVIPTKKERKTAIRAEQKKQRLANRKKKSRKNPKKNSQKGNSKKVPTEEVKTHAKPV
ncbi:MAG: DUF1080 domain-containing protein [Mariniblastus sp.]